MAKKLKCYRYEMYHSLNVSYQTANSNTYGANIYPEGEVRLQVVVEREHFPEYKCHPDADHPINNCTGCYYAVEKDEFSGRICPDIPTESVTEFVQAIKAPSGLIKCAPGGPLENRCEDGYCKGDYALLCKKTWYQCGANTKLDEAFGLTGGESRGTKTIDLSQVPTIGTGQKNAKAAWKVLQFLSSWKIRKSFDPGKECDICEFVCCLANATILQDEGNCSICGRTKEKCNDLSLISAELCEHTLGKDWSDWLINNMADSLLNCAKNGSNSPLETKDTYCPGCCGEDSN